MNEITIEQLSTDSNRITAEVNAEGRVARFVSDDPFFVEYDVDVSDVPDGLAPVPVLGQVCPVAWAAGADVRVPVLDRRFRDSLRTARDSLCAMYPSFMEGGRISAAEVVDTADSYGDTSNAGLLFTGGVDSLATYVRHREADPTLINVQGWVVGIDDDERWERTKDRIDDYGRRLDADTRFVRSNMLSFLETPLLSAHFDDQHDGGWYSAVGAGLGMLGLCAPLSVADGMGTTYIAASVWKGMEVPDVVDHWDGRAMPWGSHPDIDGNVSWGATDVVHDAFELNRQERVETIVDYIEAGHPDLPVRSCSNSETARNCGQCEKCLRTALGLALAGVDPSRHGFDVDRSSFRHAITQLERGEWLNDQHAPYHWQYFQRTASPDQDLPLDGSEEFLRWLQDADLGSVAGRAPRGRLLRSVARRVPYPMYSVLYPIYGALGHHLRDG